MKRLLLLFLLTVLAIAQEPTEDRALRIGPGDLVSVDVFDVPELHQEIRVSDSGDGVMPLIGRLHFSGLTTEQAAQAIASALEDHKLVPRPQVKVLVLEYATQGIAVMGEVRRPGMYKALAPSSLLQVMSQAGGMTETASTRISIRHPNGAEETIASPRNRTPHDAILYPGDMVFVERAGIAYIVGDVARPGGYIMQDDGALSVAQLLALGGGSLPTAKTSKAKLVRKTPHGREELEINVQRILRGRIPDVPLQPDDILFIPNSRLKTATNRLQSITQLTLGAAIYSSLN